MAEKTESKKPAKEKPAGDAGAGKKRKGGAGAGVASLAVSGKAAISPDHQVRMHAFYKEKVVPALMSQLKLGNSMEVPRLSKIVINCCVKEAVGNPKVLDHALNDIMTITGQKPVITRARKAIATFKLREGNPIGVKVTLRRARMYEFLDRFIHIVLPRVRDFRGVSAKSFDGRGNYSLGLKEQIIFPEINYEKVDSLRGMTITIETTAKTNDHSRALLKELGMPFRQ